MKLIKLNRRYKAFKEHGHRWAFQWDSYDAKTCIQVERIFQDLHGSQYSRKTGPWRSNFGHWYKNRTARPFWVTFINEQDASLVLLRMKS